jgi:hypothetical protein
MKRSVSAHRSGHFHVLPFKARNRRWVVDGDDLLVLVCDQHRLLAALDALLRALRMRRIRALRGALGVADPTVPTVVGWSSHSNHAAKNESEDHQNCLFHIAFLVRVDAQTVEGQFVRLDLTVQVHQERAVRFTATWPRTVYSTFAG